MKSNKILLVLAATILLPGAVLAGYQIGDISKGIVSVNTILGAFGLSITGLLLWIAKLKMGGSKVATAVKEWTEAIAFVKTKVTDPELRKTLDDAFEATADVAEEFKLKDIAKTLRAAL